MSFMWEPNFDHVYGCHNGHLQDGENDSRCELQEGPVCIMMEEMDGLYNNMQDRFWLY